MLSLRLNGIAIAMKCNFIGPTAAYAFKIAFDEKYAAYSPGVLLEMENMRCLREEQSIPWMDSCAIPNHSMINHLWPSRRAIETRLVSNGHWASNLALLLFPLLQTSKRFLFPAKATKP